MSTERRALIAFAASMLLFLAYDAIFISPKNRDMRARRQAEMVLQEKARKADSLAAVERGETPPPGVSTRETPRKTDTPGQPTLVPYGSETGTETEPAEPRAELADARQITVASDLYEITLTMLGGEIVSTRLLKYLTRGQPVELFPQNPGWTYERVLGVTLSGDAPAVPLGTVVFDAYRDGGGEPLLDGTRVVVDPRRDATTLVLRGSTPDGRALERAYVFYPDRYFFEASVRFDAAAFPGIHELSWGTGPGMTATEANVNDDQTNFRASALLGEEYHQIKSGHFGSASSETFSGTLNWASIQTKYFTTVLVPEEPVRAAVEVTGSKEGHRLATRVTVPAAVAGGRVDEKMRVYMGPLDVDRLKLMNVGVERTVQMGWKLVRPVSVGVLAAIKLLHRFVPNYGWVIVIISVLTKVLFFRLTHKSFKSMKQMQELQPRLQAIKEKFKGDQQRISQETMRLYKSSGVNPLGGCLPMVLQMPVFIALFNVLKFTIEVRGEAWFGWITDLSQQDVLFQLPISLPLIGNAFSLLPLLMGASMFAQSKLGGSPTGGAATTMPAGFNTLMPVVFTLMFYNMPSGLVIYWIINTVLSVAQQWYIHREPVPEMAGHAAVETVEAVEAPAPKAKRQASPAKRRKAKKG